MQAQMTAIDGSSADQMPALMKFPRRVSNHHRAQNQRSLACDIFPCQAGQHHDPDNANENDADDISNSGPKG